MSTHYFDNKEHITQASIEPVHRDSIHGEIELPVYHPTEHVVEEHRTNICGLTKHEYIALELTKAWANTTGQRYYDEEDIVNRYEDMLKEVKRRNL